MKKIAFLMLLGLVSLVACQNDEFALGGEEITRSITVSIPSEGTLTRATTGDGAQVDRCIMEIYHHGVIYDRKVVEVTSGAATFDNIRLVTSQEYDFLFWADNSGEGHADEYYNTANGLKNITYVSGKYKGNNDELDAFYHAFTETITSDFTFTGIKLTRPFAQLNVETTDEFSDDQIANHPEFLPKKVNVKFVSVPTSFNVLTGIATAEAALEYTSDVKLGENDAYLEGANEGALLSVDYLFTQGSTEQDLINFEIEFQEADGDVITTNDKFNNIPIKRNYKTNVYGKLLTAGGSVSVTVEATFNTPDISKDIESAQTVSVANEMLAANTGDKNIAVMDAPTTADAAKIEIPANYATGNDNQVALTLPALTENSLTYTIEAPATKNGETTVAPAVITITVNEGDVNKVKVNAPGSTVYINGTLQSVEADASANTLIVNEGAIVENLKVNQGGVEIYGQVKNLTFAEEVHATNPATLKVYTVYTAEEWAKAIDLKAKKIILGADITLENEAATVAMPAACTELNLNAKTLTAVQLKWTEQSDINIANGTLQLDHNDIALDFNVVNSKLSLDKVVLNAPNASGEALNISSNALETPGGCTVTISGSTINATKSVENYMGGAGVVSHGINTIVIEDSEINHKSYGVTQNGVNPGSNITLNNTKINGTRHGIYLSNQASGPVNILSIDRCDIITERSTPIEVKKTNIKVVNSTLESQRTDLVGYYLEPSGPCGVGHGIVLAGYAGTKDAPKDPLYYEGTIEVANNTYKLAGKDHGAEDVYAYNGVSYDMEDTYYIYNKDGMYWVANQTAAKNTFAGKTVALFQDIYFAKDEAWTPIGGAKSGGNATIEGYPGDSFNGTFDGNNHRIVGMNVSSKGWFATAGLFGAACGVIKNLIIDGATVNSTHYAGAIIGYSSNEVGNFKVENCHVINSNITSTPEYYDPHPEKNGQAAYDNGDKAGGIFGYLGPNDNIINCTVKNTTITGYRDLGGIVGFANENSKVTGCQVLENVKVVIKYTSEQHYKEDYTTQDKHDAGSIVGENHGTIDSSCTGTATIVYEPNAVE